MYRIIKVKGFTFLMSNYILIKQLLVILALDMML